MEGLLGKHKELENQSIYFASPEQLNDPLEGYRDFFWSGDRIAWKNLFRHYLLCLERACTLLMISGEDHYQLSISDLPVFAAMDNFPTDDYRKRFQTVQDDFFGREDVTKHIDGLTRSSRKIRRDELRFHLQNAHFIALESIAKINQADGLIARRVGAVSNVNDLMARTGNVDYFELLSKISTEEEKGEEAAEAIFQAYTHVHTQLALIDRYSKTVDATAKNKNFVILDFPDQYLKAIERLVFPDWYTACFMSECSNSSVWGHYSVNHTGVCLIFESSEVGGRHYLPLNGYNSIGGSGPMKGILQMPFHTVVYTEGFAKMDFFRSLGRLPMPVLKSMWYTDAGNVSTCAQALFTDEDGWRKRYWNNFIGDILRKTKDWSYEHEHRLILYGSVVDYSDSQYRTLNYDFSSLKGLIFGINARTEDKLEVMRIIHRKCVEHKRMDFQFFQAYYSPKERHIKHVQLNLLQTN